MRTHHFRIVSGTVKVSAAGQSASVMSSSWKKMASYSSGANRKSLPRPGIVARSRRAWVRSRIRRSSGWATRRSTRESSNPSRRSLRPKCQRATGTSTPSMCRSTVTPPIFPLNAEAATSRASARAASAPMRKGMPDAVHPPSVRALADSGDRSCGSRSHQIHRMLQRGAGQGDVPQHQPGPGGGARTSGGPSARCRAGPCATAPPRSTTNVGRPSSRVSAQPGRRPASRSPARPGVRRGTRRSCG